MAVKITPKPDDRAERIIADPDAYYAAARERARSEVEQEMRREQEARKRRS
ncbi:hypothetical protein [Antrihabitans cavernicola]|uniref:hypothetical protein n=1 Tax=Antrihabitans cavernicola TaxID=2495913 RepID=UPI001658D8FA|nr:hypothetical protein [Spelaeibacter cavernicola]